MARSTGRVYYRAINENGEEYLKPYTCLSEVWESATTVDWLLWMLDQINSKNDKVLRLFACWCARQSCEFIGGDYHSHIIEVAERFARGEATREELATTRAKAGAGAAGAGVCGLPKRIPSAATHLAAFHTTSEDAFDCAYQSAKYAVLTASFAKLRESLDKTQSREAERVARLDQAKRLTEMVGNPFDVCIIEIGVEPELLAELMMLGFAPRLHQDNRYRWHFYSELFEMSGSLEDIVLQFLSDQGFLM